MARGSQIASKIVEFMAHILSEENLSESSTLDSEVPKSTLCYHRIDLVPKINVFWVLIVPVWLPILFVIPGIIVGLIIRKLLNII